MNQIPGQFRAYSLWLAATLAVVARVEVAHQIVSLEWPASVTAPLGIVLLVLGGALGSQTTHLAQEEHQGETRTWLEAKMESARWSFVALGFMIAALGVLIAV